MDSSKRQETLLINWVYYPPVGHAVEAFRRAIYNRVGSNPDLKIAVLLSADTTFELGQCVTQIDETYTVDISQFDELGGDVAFAHIPRDWDYVFTDPRHDNPTGSGAMDRCQSALRDHLRAKVVNRGWDMTGFPEGKVIPLVFSFPKEVESFADEFCGTDTRIRISLLFGSGSERSRTPPMSFWHRLIMELSNRYNVEFVLLGTMESGKTRTCGVSAEDVDKLTRSHSNVRNAFDIGLLNQLAIARMCDLHISPHSGMMFAIQCVGTPFICLSGPGTEGWLNGVPFVCIFSDCNRHPCGWGEKMLEGCAKRALQGKPYACLDDSALTAKIPEILDAAQMLIEKKSSFYACLTQHQHELYQRGLCDEDEWPYDAGLGPSKPEYEYPREHDAARLRCDNTR